MFKLNRNKAIMLLIIIIGIGVGIYYIFYPNISELFIHQEDVIDNIEDNNKTNDINKEISSKGEGSDIVVHISGAVHNEGIVKLKEGSRVADAIEEAGGVREDAYTKDLNLAYKLEDGVKIYIPTLDENNKESTQDKNQNDKSDVISSVNSNISTSNKDNKNKKVNINTANQTELETLPGIGASTASKIIAYREENGKFKTIEDIKKVNGIGENKYKNIKESIEV